MSEPRETAMGALEAALRGLACRCHGDDEGHEASNHLTSGEREIFELVRAVAPAGAGDCPPAPSDAISDDQATRALALALADGFRAQGVNTMEAAAGLIREHDELIEENARLRAVRPPPRAARRDWEEFRTALPEAEWAREFRQRFGGYLLPDVSDENLALAAQLSVYVLLPRLGAASPAAAPPQEEGT